MVAAVFGGKRIKIDGLLAVNLPPVSGYLSHELKKQNLSQGAESKKNGRICKVLR
jgi:hypothetical protein